MSGVLLVTCSISVLSNRLSWRNNCLILTWCTKQYSHNLLGVFVDFIFLWLRLPSYLISTPMGSIWFLLSGSVIQSSARRTLGPYHYFFLCNFDIVAEIIQRHIFRHLLFGLIGINFGESSVGEHKISSRPIFVFLLRPIVFVLRLPILVALLCKIVYVVLLPIFAMFVLPQWVWKTNQILSVGPQGRRR